MTSVRVVQPATTTVGGVPILRLVPADDVAAVGPWTYVDWFGPAVLQQPARRQANTQSLTWLFSGHLRHTDSTGSDTTYGPGQAVVVTAGAGVEVAQASVGGEPATGVALRLAAPGASDLTPSVEEFWPEPVRVGDHEVAIIVGEFGFEDSPVATHLPALACEVRFASDDPLVVPVMDGWEYVVIAEGAALRVGDVEVPAGRAAIVTGEFAVGAAADAGHVVRGLLLGGAALAAPSRSSGTEPG